MELIGLNITPSVKQVQHHLENATISIRNLRPFFLSDLVVELEEADKLLGTKGLLLCPKSETEAVSIFFAPEPVLTTLTRAAKKLWGVMNTFACHIPVESGYSFIWTEMDFWTYPIINIMHVISLIFKIILPKLLKNKPNQTNKTNQNKKQPTKNLFWHFQ